MAAVVRALEEDIFLLCERVPDKQTALEKQRLYSRVGQFLMGSFDGHWWCRYPTLMTFMVRIFELLPGPESVRVFHDKMAQQLAVCTKCVDIYHSAMPSVRAELENEFTPASVKEFFHKVSQLDAQRLHSVFAPKDAAASGSQSSLSIKTALYEILSHRRLWSDYRILRVVSKWLSSTPADLKEASIDKDVILRSCPGILQWLVSPDAGIRSWATSLVGKHGIEDMTAETSDGREWMKVLDEWMYILESGSFNVSLLNLELPTTGELPLFLDPVNCVKTPTNQILWAALDTIMQKMNENSLEALLESFDNLPDLVFNYLNDADPASTNPQITFVICKCYASLMRCLGHRYWNHTVHSPKVVLDLIIHHSQLPSWRVFVTKQLIELLPPLIASMRPPSKATNESNQRKIAAYFEARRRVLTFLLKQDERPAHFNSDQVLCVARSKAVSTLICDCYEPRLLASASNPSSGATESKRDDGALPETSLVDLSVIESSFWWPCGPSFEDIELLWMNHLFLLLVNPENVVSLVDHVATTCTTVLLKHLTLAREVVYAVTNTGDTFKPLSAVLPQKPIITRILERLCSWETLATVPIVVHGALFESIGGMAELHNVMQAQQESFQAIDEFKPTLKKYETLVCSGYLERMSSEVFEKGLTNPLRFPVVGQHLTVCLLSPNPQVDQKIKRLLAHAGASKSASSRDPTLLESLLVVIHRNTEAYLRGILSLLQGWRLHDFGLRITLPTVKKVAFLWTKVFEMLSNDIKKAIEASVHDQTSDETAAGVNLQKVPVLLGDLLARLLAQLYCAPRPSSITVEESVLIQCLDLGSAFWRFFLKEDKEVASSKRFEGMVAPLARCMETVGGQAEKRRAAELLMTLVEAFVDGKTRIDDASIGRLESLKASTTASIESKKSTDFSRMAGKLRQVSKASRFFAPRPIKAQRRSKVTVVDLSGDDRAPKRGAGGDDLSRSLDDGSYRPMSGKAAAREQARLAAARSASNTIFEASSKKGHSFYDEDDFAASSSSSQAKRSSASSDPKAKVFNISQVLTGMDQTRPGSHRSDDAARSDGKTIKKVEEEPEEEEEEDEAPNLAALFFKIKNTQKAIPTASLLPFFRHLLQVSMPALLTKEFQNERSDRELSPPPFTFAKSSEYANAFLPLLLEECHNEVQEGLRRCYFSSGKNNGHLLRYESEKPREGMRCLNFSVVESTTSSSDNGGRPGGGGGFWRREKLFHNADVVLLRSVGNRQNAGNIDFLGVILISDTERGKRRQSGPGGPGGAAKSNEELVRILFLNDGELESVTSEIPTFQMEAVTASAIAETEWRVTTLGNLVTASREYVALRSVDMLPEHLRTTILTPSMYETTQTELIRITTVLDELRAQKNGRDDADRKIFKLLTRLDKMDVSLTDLRSTSIGKAVNKLRKHDNDEVKTQSNALKDKWTKLMDKKDSLDVAPRYVASELWDAIKGQYNQSQLQSIHSVLNNYSAGISLLQGPPGTGKTKTIMGLLSGFLALKMPPMAVQPQSSRVSVPSGGEKPTETFKAGSASAFSNFDLFREMAAKQGTSTASASNTFSLSGTLASSRILRHTDDATGPKPTAMQAIRNAGSVRSRLESKMSGSRPASADILRRTLAGPSVMSLRPRGAASKTSNVLLCAPSNGAVDELVLRIVTDGLMDTTGKVTKVRAPSVHPDASTEWLSIVRLGNPGEDAPDIVKAVCLPHIIKQELAIHPKTIELRELQERQRTLRASIKEFHEKRNEEKNQEGGGAKKGGGKRGGLAKTHAELTECSGKVRRLRDEVSALESKMTASILSKASIIACTLSKAGSGQFNGLQRGFDALIIDEAAQAVELSTLVPIRERVARVVLVGDPKQLPATVKSVVAANARFDRSLFERIAESGVAPSMLRVQYRMHPFLREFPSKRFYGGMLTDGPSVMERVQRVCGDLYKHPYFQPFLLYDLIDTRESDFNGSKFNKDEASFCIDLCASLFAICPDLRAKKWSVGFVSPYKEQVRVIRQEVNRCTTIPSSISIEVNTVDGFQGREKDVIIFSCVRASDRGGIGFLKDIRRLNVAITRARFCLFVVGSARTLRRDETWNALVQNAQERKLVIRAKASLGFSSIKEELDRDRSGLKAHYEEMHEKLVSKKAPLPAVKAEETSRTKEKRDTAHEAIVKDESPVKKEQTDGNTNAATDTKMSVERATRQAESGSSRPKREHENPPTPPSQEKKPKIEVAFPLGMKASAAVSSEGNTRPPAPTDAGHVDQHRSSSHHSVSSHSRAPSKDRSRSRGRDERRDRPPPHAGDRGRRDRHHSSLSASSSAHDLKRPRPPYDCDAEPNKCIRLSRDAQRRSRSRSRERPSSVSRREGGSRETTPRANGASSDGRDWRHNGRHGGSEDVKPAGVVREKERTADQKHRERQERLRALSKTADARAAASGPRAGQASGSGRIVQLIRSGSRSGGSTPTGGGDSTRRGGGGSLLSNILGSSSQLTQSTSRVDPANARRDQ